MDTEQACNWLLEQEIGRNNEEFKESYETRQSTLFRQWELSFRNPFLFSVFLNVEYS